MCNLSLVYFVNNFNRNKNLKYTGWKTQHNCKTNTNFTHDSSFVFVSVYGNGEYDFCFRLDCLKGKRKYMFAYIKNYEHSSFLYIIIKGTRIII